MVFNTEKTTQQFINYIRENFTYQNGNLYDLGGNQLGWYDKSCKYFKIKIKRKTYLLHRIIFAYHHGYFPEYVDHKDRNKLHNRIENLRDCSEKSLNSANQEIKCTNSSGYKGVSKREHKWRAYINRDGKRYYLGNWDNPEEAAKAYDNKAKELFGEFAKLNFN